MAKTKQPELELSEIAQIIRRHPGSMTAIADDLGIRLSTVSNVLSARIGSARVLKAAHRKALTLLAQERRAEAGVA